MSPKYEKLKTLLLELFQLDKPELDFGIYRVMHAKNAEVSQFLDKDLLPQVQVALGQYKTADKAELETELAKAIEQAQALGADAETLPKVKDLRARLKTDAVDVGALESEVYDHLFSFFRRYYSEGDFLAKRVYKQGVYAIPYEGEEVTLHWANRDQYYIKTSEYLRDYAFRLKPDDEANPMRVHFRLADAAEGEHGNVKAAEGQGRVFVLAAGGESGRDFITEEGGEQGKELSICFEYRPATLADWPENERGGKKKPPAQKELSALAAKQVLAVADESIAPWIAELGKPYALASGEVADYTRIETHLRRYTARNTFDYFIHKDLGTFLRRELDFYIKNEVMHLDDVENETVPRVEQYLSKIKVIRKIAEKIIAFLAQLEDFQKKLWQKKKFVVDTQWCIRLGLIPEEFYVELAANEAQRDEWIELFAIDEIKGDLTTPGYSSKLTSEFLKAHPTLVVDTRHFDADFTVRMIEATGEIDDQTDGLLFHSENFQALSLMKARYREHVKCIYIDPPYNTGSDGFPYKDNYQHSSWASMLLDRVLLSRTLLRESGLFFCSLDDREVNRASQLINSVYSEDGFVSDITIVNNLKGRQDRAHIATAHEHLLMFQMPLGESFGFALPEDRRTQFEREDEAGYSYELRDLRRRGGGDRREDRPNMYFPIFWNEADKTASLERKSTEDVEITPKRSDGSDGRWRWGMERVQRCLNILEAKPVAGGVRWNIDYRVYLDKDGMRRMKPKSFWNEPRYSTDNAVKMLKAMIPEVEYPSPKAVGLLSDVFSHGSDEDDLICDFFAGSGTTGHAVISLNRDDGGKRKMILVEMGDYFDTVLLPRIKKVTFTPEWKDGKPNRLATPEEAERSPRIVKVVRLESYEDALNNLETHRTKEQQGLLDLAQAQATDGLKEQYILSYMLDVETRGSQSLLNVQAFTDPTAYKLKFKRPGSDESREVNVDLLETFNWLIGLTVKTIAAPQVFSAAFERDGEDRLRLKGRLKQEVEAPYWFRTVTGTTPDGRRTLIIWRKLTGEPEQDNLVLDEWFTKKGYSAKDSEFDLIYVNGGNSLENLKTADDLWKVRLTEEDFHRLMFEAEGP
ncbi:site-specific DNA-methyltransferase [Synechococcus sp. J7-Johnson]|uniref:site-specific DNA-methyltransferase n=1 Tax=Synechococcus sp. J7-Johnson TaxID=2823737 RepID=UPI0020CC464C|nr:site-specific DNA-methyltransferase [Synechococcus sp. J7-Johnson]MCP9840177.1 site-specific DNA-methyltransferase [Synechococcus sp. J7-Johnson]